MQIFAKHAPSRRRGFTNGFTLVELLVVVGIIVTLIAILLPILAAARDQANTTVCLSNLTQIGLSFQAYETKNRDYLPPLGYETTSSGWTDLWCTIMAYDRDLNVPWVTSTALATQKSILICPNALLDNLDVLNGATTDPIQGGAATSRTDQKAAGVFRNMSTVLNPNMGIDTTYGINGTAAGNWQKSPFYPYPFASPNFRKISVITDPSDMVLLYDGFGFDQGGVNANRINLRHTHKTTCNILFADGHAGNCNYKQLPGETLGDAGQTVDANGWVPCFELTSPVYPYGPGVPKWRLDQP